jgi:NADPH:quinone reductase-like Zn-dependent oxidoreductase
MILDDSVDTKYAANIYCNPLTVIAFMELTKTNKSKAVIVTAASSSLSKIYLRLA